MKRRVGGAIALLGAILCLCEIENHMLYLACGCRGVVLMAIGADIAGVYIKKEDKTHE